MNKSRINSVAAAILLILGTGCSSDNENEDSKTSKLLDNTVWTYSNDFFHKSSSLAIDENKVYPAVKDKVSLLQELGYTDDVNEENRSLDWDLCELSGHECDTTITAKFNSGKCIFDFRFTRAHLKAEKTTTEKLYKFREGSYIITTDNMHYGVDVYNYAIYMSTTGGKVLYLPLDGNCCALYEKNTVYRDKQWHEEKVNEYSIATDYTISGNTLTFSYDDNGQKKNFNATFDKDGQNIIFDANTITHKTAYFKK